MKDKERPILYISLALNLVLVVLLILSYTGEPEAIAVAEVTAVTPSNPIDAIDTIAATPTQTYTPTPRPSDTAEPPTATIPPTATEAPTETPSPTIIPSATPTETPIPTPLPTPTPSPTPIPQPGWLVYVNTFRSLAGVETVTDNADWSEGSRLHSVYMVNTDDITHDPDSNSEWFTEAGRLAAENGNIAATEYLEATYYWAVNYWMSAPFHALPILDPELTTVGFGFYAKQSTGVNSGNVGGVNVAATLDIQRGLVSPSLHILNFPISFPPNGGETWVLKHDLYEYPDPLSSCPGYSRPAGAPIIIQTGSGTGRANVSNFLFTVNGVASAACMFTESSYTNSDANAQRIGRYILDSRDAVVIIPRNPLQVGNVYEVTLNLDGEPYTTTFTAVASPY